MLKLNKIYCMDNVQGMRQMEPEIVDLTVTSPPYDNLRKYNGYSFDFENVAKELHRVTKQGGVVVWVVGDATINGSETGTSFRQALYFMECGFKLHDTMIYIKNGGINRGSLYAYQQKFEYMFIFVKGDIKCVNLIHDRKNKYVEDRIKQVRQKDGTYKEQHFKTLEYGVRYNYWIYDTGKHNGEVYNHPAQFPLPLAKDHIISWSNEGDIVLDCFMGSGTTAVAAQQLGRKYIGFEISQQYVDLANKRLQETKTLFD